ncbi:ABC transporter, putative [Hepatocystis sp. ex Piliocolobus tephrosceles]|nr:ABC transporter, putative [Hepatocystis sp. ex Piliocolobus tephrosceles]
MTFHREVRSLNKNSKKEVKHVTFFSFITFHWVTQLLNNIKKEGIKFPKLHKKSYVQYYALALEENLRKISVNKKCSFSNSYKNSKLDGESNYNSQDAMHVEYIVNYSNILWSFFKTFMIPILSLIIIIIMQTLFVLFIGITLDNYSSILKGKTIPHYPNFLNNSSVTFGLYFVVLMLVEIFLDAILNFYFYEFRVNLLMSMKYFLYKITLSTHSNNLTNYYSSYRNSKYVLNKGDNLERIKSHKNVNEDIRGVKTKFEEANDQSNMLNKNFYKIFFFNRENSNEGENEMKKKDSSDLNIYNIMFTDISSLVQFISAIINIFNIIVKFYVAFYACYSKMGYDAVKFGFCLFTAFYGTIILFEFLTSLLRNKYLKYRDKRICNLHHVLKNFKLIKMFNWEPLAFNYVNFFRKKEMKICKLRLYLSTIAIFINAVSADIIEVVMFYYFIKDKIYNQKDINFSSIIMPLFVYKSLISNLSSFPNLLNCLLEGNTNIKRLNKYIYQQLYYNDINNYFKYISKINSDNYNISKASFDVDTVTEHYDKYTLFNNKSNNIWRKILSYLTLNRNNRHVYIINKKVLSGLYYEMDRTSKKICFETPLQYINCYDIVTHVGKNQKINNYDNNNDNNNNKLIFNKENDLIIKLEDFTIDLNKKGDKFYSTYTLQNINFILKNNTLAIIIGNIGSGKTVFFKSILGYYKLLNGSLFVKNVLYRMPILYVPQDSWLSIGNVRSIILFGNEYNDLIYRHAIIQSEMVNDILSFENKDMRYINDEHNLSKGQQTRIVLARVLYNHYIHMHKNSILYEKKKNSNINFKKEKIENSNLINNQENVNTQFSYEAPFDEDAVKRYLKHNNISYLYLLDDIFTSLDPSISKNIFYNLFCKEEKNKCFKDNCSFVVTINEHIFNSFLISNIIENIQYNVDIYELQYNSLRYIGNISDYVEKKNINIIKENSFNKTRLLNIDCSELKLQGETENVKDKNIYYNNNYDKLTKDSYDKDFCEKINTTVINPNIKNVINSVTHVKNKNSISSNRKINVDIEKSNETKNKLMEHERENKMLSILSIELKKNNNFDKISDNISDNISDIIICEDESSFKGNIQLKTYIWFFKNVGYLVIFCILIFMFLSIITDELKFLILSMFNIISKKDEKYSNELSLYYTKNLKLFVLLPILSLIASFFCFMFIIYGTVKLAVNMHSNMLNSMFYAPLYIYYNSNLGNVINRFITDVYSLDSGFLKRFYKIIFLFFRVVMLIFLLFWIMKDSIFILLFVLFLVYLVVFKKYSNGCKEAQREYLRCISPLCHIYSNTVLGKAIINVYEKNNYYLNIHNHYIENFRKSSILVGAINIWASLYIRIITLLLTIYFIMYPYIIYKKLNILYEENVYRKMINDVIYCMVLSTRISGSIKTMLYDYTFVEKEMCCVQRLEEFIKTGHENDYLENKNEKQVKKYNKKKEKEEKVVEKKNDLMYSKSTTFESIATNCPGINESKKMYGIHFENVFISYKKKVILDKNNNSYVNYVNEEPALKNINFYALKNQKIGIIGKTGSGKSTIILSILGLINVNNGTITIEGKDINTMNQKERNNVISVLPQSCFFFRNWKIRDFIDPYQNYTDKEILEAFNIIGINLNKTDLYKCIHEQQKNGINNDKKKEEEEEEKEKRERKKINAFHNTISLTDDSIRYLSLVRLFLNRNKYKLILIDEIPIFTFNKVNPNVTNFLVQDAKPFNYIIKNYFPNNTVLIISHDTNTLSCCDFIYVLKNGEIVHGCSCKDIKSQTELGNLLEKDY